MRRSAFITCAVTGAGDTASSSEKVPVTPRQIAESCIEAANCGAAVVHIHVRDPETGAPARDPQLYRCVVDLIDESGVDVVLNLTGGMGGDLVLGGADSPLPPSGETDLVGASERLAHVEEILPEICTLDCGSMNWTGDPNYLMVNTKGMLDAMARRLKELGVHPELEVFDSGQLDAVGDLRHAGLLEMPPLVQLCMGLRYGAPADLVSLASLVQRLEPGDVFSAFSVGAMQLPFVALAVIAGGNVRVGLEDNLYLSKGVPASNGELVSRAVDILGAMDVHVMEPVEVRSELGLQRRWGGNAAKLREASS